METQAEMLCKNIILANLNDKQILQAEQEFKEQLLRKSKRENKNATEIV